MQLAHFFRDAGFSIRDELNGGHGEATQARHVLGAIACADTAAILIEVSVDDIVATVFDGPMAAIGGQDTLWIGLFRRATGNPQSGFHCQLAGLFVKNLPLDQEGLADMRKVEVGIERRTTPDAPGFDSAMVRWRDIDEIGRLAILEQKRDIALERGLIAFDCEVVMRPAVHDIGPQFALRQQGIGGDVLALNIQSIQQRNEHPDFIGLLGLFAARYGQSADFFWV